MENSEGSFQIVQSFVSTEFQMENRNLNIQRSSIGTETKSDSKMGNNKSLAMGKQIQISRELQILKSIEFPFFPA